MTGHPQRPAAAQSLSPLDALSVDEVRTAEVLVVGSGIAGLTVALGCQAREVTVVTTGRLGREGSSAWAQGGIAAALGPDDSPELHAADTLRAGAGLVDPAAAEALAGEARRGIQNLLELGARFDRDVGGGLALGREAAHLRRRILHAHGDATGAEVMRALTAAVHAASHVQVAEDSFALDLVLDLGAATGGLRVVGALALDGGRLVFHRAPVVVLATGGLGGAFLYTTNPAGVRGDGLALALRAGARLMDVEMVQLHPTALDVSRLGSQEAKGGAPAGESPGARLPLLTEALRGEGAVLIDETGTRFMTSAHPEAELAPRDIVARAIHRHREAGREVFLDARSAVGARFRDRFPTVFALCHQRGLDPRHEPLPVTPAAHYHMGGVATDLQGRTSVPGLWACGEVACTGSHGANRLASNSLLEGLVFGFRVAADVLRAGPGPGTGSTSRTSSLWTPAVPGLRRRVSGSPRITAIRRCLWRRVGLIRDAAGLSEALTSFDAMEQELAEAPAEEGSVEERNLIQVARTLTVAALAREESRGAHFRSDFPTTRRSWKSHLVVGGRPCGHPRMLCLLRRPVGEGLGVPPGRSRDLGVTKPQASGRPGAAVAGGRGSAPMSGSLPARSDPAAVPHRAELPSMLYEPLLRRALQEDLGRVGDLTTDALVPAEARATAEIVARRAGRIAGLSPSLRTFSLLDDCCRADVLIADGEDADAGAVLARVRGPARALLTAERTALNLLGRLSGIATATREMVRAVGDHDTVVVDTRKTTPGLRALEKWAVRLGGGSNHRFGLDDAVLIKDNHRLLAGGVGSGVRRARAGVGHLVKIEVEVDTLEELDEALNLGVDAVLLDNMTPEQLREAVTRCRAQTARGHGRVLVEASGGITLETVAEVAATGVDLISVGWLTHSAPSLDVSLEVVVGGEEHCRR